MRNRTLLFCAFIIVLLICDKCFYQEINSNSYNVGGNLNFSFIKELIIDEKEKCNLRISKIQKHIEKLEKQNRVKYEFAAKINSLTFENRKNDFLSYKKILDEYREYSYIQIPLTVYDEYDIGEIKVFQRLVAAETTGGDFESKCNVASVVWNRLNSEKYPDNIIDVIYQRNGSVQFSPTYDGRIDNVEVTENDVLAVEYTYMFGSTAYDCIAFDNVRGDSWNKNKLEVVFTDSINHTFYR